MSAVNENDDIFSSQSSELDEQQLHEMEESSKPTSTKRATIYGIRKFTEWLEKRSKLCDFHTVTKEELNELLRKFYAEVKAAKKGGSLTPSTLTCLRAAIHRHITSAPFNRPFNIISENEFMSANNMFTARCKLYFKAGNKKPQHKPCIGDGDMVKLGTYFSNWSTNPTVLVEACWFFLCYNFGRRGREGWTAMTKKTFVEQEDSEGHEYIAPAHTEVTKNHQGGHKQTNIDYSDQRMYGPGVGIYKFYISKLNPKCERLFQTPLQSYQLASHWYSSEPMGKNPLGSIMKKISQKAGLSCIYTCHSVRASTITKLFQAGVSAHSIIAITKHKNISSLSHYIEDISTEQKRECSKILSAKLSLPSTSTVTSTSCIIPVESIDDDDDNMPNFDLGFAQESEPTSEDMSMLDLPTEPDQQAVAVDLQMGPDGIITIPESGPPGTVYNVNIPGPGAELSTNAAPSMSQTSIRNNFSPQSHHQNAIRNIMTHATLNSCTINFQLKND